VPVIHVVSRYGRSRPSSRRRVFEWLDRIEAVALSSHEVLQYAAAGTPAVTSPVGVNRQITSRLDAPAPEGPEDWVDAILDLLSRSAEARAALDCSARDLVAARYYFDAWLPTWERAVGPPSSAT
jgi:glycosyltransferase involved in cell wall biosynthesis